MRKVLAAFLLVLLIISCSTNPPKPPEPPQPPPVNLCGNGTCDATIGEDATTCAEDCLPPEPPPEPKTCQKGIKTRWLTFGYYSLFGASDPSGIPNYDKFAEEVCASKYTGIYVHLLSPWDKVKGGVPKADDWPFVFRVNKFDVTAINQLWVSKLNQFLNAFGKRGLDVGISFVDQYCCTPGLNKFLPQPWHPFRQNGIGINWNSCAECLYSSITFAPLKFNHVSWTNVDEHKLKWNFAVKTPAAKMIDLYTSAVVKSVSDALDRWPNMRVGWKWANETKGGDTIKDSLGDRSEMIVFISEKFSARGYKPMGKRLISFVDREFIGSNQDVHRKVLHDSIVRFYGIKDGLGAKHEVHGMCDPATILARFASGTDDKEGDLPANDGNRCSPFYPKGPAQIIKMMLPFTDIKMEEAWTNFPNYKQGDINISWKKYSKPHLELAN